MAQLLHEKRNPRSKLAEGISGSIMSRLASSPVLPLDDEDLLQEILIRLSPQPSSLPRASLVCPCWRSILSNHKFLCRFRKHHRKPPLLGFFARCLITKTTVFTSVLDSPDRIPAGHFLVPHSHNPSKRLRFMGCRHGLAVLFEMSLNSPMPTGLIVWDPLTGQQHNHLTMPPGLNGDKWKCWNSTVLCTNVEDGHVHGDCFSNPFKFVLIFNRDTDASACVYESTSGVWGDIVSVVTKKVISPLRPSILIGNVLYWLLVGGEVLVHDFERQSLGMIEKPADTHNGHAEFSYHLLRTEDNGLGLAIVSNFTIKLWERKSNRDGVVGWEFLKKVAPLDGLFPEPMLSGHMWILLVGYDEDTNVIVLSTMTSTFMLQLDSMQIRDISVRTNLRHPVIYPYRNFYTAGEEKGTQPRTTTTTHMVNCGI
ncbi:hypothetical protein CFC21_039794 [Triticum aestivum]|uniref:Uncharacterized protein n=2 Tax=Triticum aestivum TaxID=4565 RepID=A0A3B6FKI7_WHEAT|nr:uncharacterized protein LOC123068637 isoform X1 [Triticum aestivum]KAF7027783.1 hypothetical protein CFC21_039794 [Triticum aestivum]